MRGRHETLGVLSFGFERPREFAEDQVRLAQAFADAVATATERLRYLEAERSGRERVAVLARAWAEIFEAADPTSVGEVVLNEIAGATGAAMGTMVLLDPTDESIYVLASFGLVTDAPAGRRPSSERSPVASALRADRTEVIEGMDDYASRYPDLAPAMRAAGFRSFVNTPMKAHGQIVGALSIAHSDRTKIEPGELSFLESMATTAALAIDRLRARRLLEEVSAQIPVGLAVTDARGRLITVNDQAERSGTARCRPIR